MIWATLALLGVPLWLILGALGATLWSRRQVMRSPGVFRIRLRTRPSAGEPPEWERRTAYAMWAHDVLLVHSGPALAMTEAIGVQQFLAAHSAIDARFAHGREARSLTVRCDDGTIREVAVAEGDHRLLHAPFAKAFPL